MIPTIHSITKPKETDERYVHRYCGSLNAATEAYRKFYGQEPERVYVWHRKTDQLVFIPKPKENLPCTHTSMLSR